MPQQLPDYVKLEETLPDYVQLEKPKESIPEYKGPTTFGGGFLKSLTSGEAGKASALGALGYLQGATLDVIPSIAKGAIAATEAVGALNPIANMMNPNIGADYIRSTLGGMVGGIPESLRGIATTAAQAGSNPYEFGQMMGHAAQPGLVGKYGRAATVMGGTPTEAIGAYVRRHAPVTRLTPGVRFGMPFLTDLERQFGSGVESLGKWMKKQGPKGTTIVEGPEIPVLQGEVVPPNEAGTLMRRSGGTSTIPPRISGTSQKQLPPAPQNRLGPAAPEPLSSWPKNVEGQMLIRQQANEKANLIARSPNKSGILSTSELYRLQDQPGRIKNIVESENLNKLRESIKQKGIQEPVILKRNIDGTFSIEDGHHRVAIAKELGIENIPVKIGEKGSRSSNMPEPPAPISPKFGRAKDVPKGTGRGMTAEEFARFLRDEKGEIKLFSSGRSSSGGKVGKQGVAKFPSGGKRQVYDLAEQIRDNIGNESLVDDLMTKAEDVIMRETDLEIIKDNLNQLDVYKDYAKAHGNPDELELLGTLRDIALDKYRQSLPKKR